MLNLKHDVKVNIPHEKEWKRWLLYVFMVLGYTYLIFNIPDYIWNMTVYRFARYVIDVIKLLLPIWYIRKLGLKKDVLFGGKNLAFQLLTGCGFAVLAALIVSIPDIKTGAEYLRATSNIWTILDTIYRYVLLAGIVEELMFRIAMQEGLSKLIGSKKMSFIVPLITAVLFGIWHYPFAFSMKQVCITAIMGLFWGYGRMYAGWNLIGLAVSHSVYDVLVIYLPTWLS